MHDENFPLFAVSTLAPSARSTPPIPNVYIPPRCVNPKAQLSVGRPYGALNGRWGSAQ
ncbi:hypothetical protein EDD22DRAFT_769715 [Suillus occidentalis]|nr:hypothetical protein EDD22DRAFT_769715 [Suillus occidentalis]